MDDKILMIVALVLGIGTGVLFYKKSHVDQPLTPQQQQQNWNNWGPTQPPKPENTPEQQAPDNSPGGKAATYKEALEMAKAKQRPVFLFFSASWCDACNQMKQTTFNDAQVQKALEPYVVCFVNAEAERATAKQFQVRDIPAYFVISPTGQQMLSGVGKREPQQFLEWLSGQSDGRFQR